MNHQPERCTVVFDLDGTLIDSAPDLAGALNELLTENGRPQITLADVRMMVGDGAVALIERGFAQSGGLDGVPMANLRNRFLDLYERRMTTETVLYPGAVETLHALSGHGCRIALCTNKPVAMAASILDHLGILDRFAAVLGGDSLPVRKPDPQHLRTTIERASGSTNRAAMIGDSQTDVLTARRANVPVLAVSYGYTSEPAHDLGADEVVDRLDEIPAILVQMGVLE